MEAKKWWKEAIGYQIYPRSFKDSNHDGIGDIKGIISKLDYIKDLGVNLIWVGPIYQSPMDDNGYDVSDFFNIAKEYGTLEDVEMLIDQVHKRDMKIIFDLILNHTSDEHYWFVESKKSKTNTYRNFYIWKDGKEDGPPTNWASYFEGSCWKYDANSDQYFMKIFSEKMPDLNWINPKVRKHMHDMTKWWLDKGIDGFRIDAIAHLAKDQSFTDGYIEGNQKYSQQWSKFSNLKEVHDYLKEFNKEVFSKYDCVTIGECGGSASLDDALKYSGYDSCELDMSFTFDHCWENGAFGADYKTDEELKTNVVNLKRQFSKWQKALYTKAWNPLYWLNHDHPRVISQYGDVKNYFKESGKMLCNTLYFMWGTPFVYNGEEIGMTNVDYTKIEQFSDIWIKNYQIDAKKRGLSDEQILRHLRRSSRANARTPMQWDNSAFAGFSSHQPWIDVVGNYQVINVKQQQSDPTSILNHYKKILHLRSDSEYKNTIVYGTFNLLDEEHPKVFAYIRELDKKIVVISNFTKENTTFSLNDFTLKKLLASNYVITDEIKLHDLKLRPFESLIIEVN